MVKKDLVMIMIAMDGLVDLGALRAKPKATGT